MTESKTLFFDDARSCKAWLTTIAPAPVSSAQITSVQQLILDALRMFSQSSASPLDRLTCMELLRDKVNTLLTEQRKHYRGKMLPLSNSEYAAWEVSTELLREMEMGYSYCGNLASDAGSGLEAHTAFILQRTLRYIGLQMLMAGFIYRRFDEALWSRLHAQWSAAEALQLTTKPVKDTVGAADIKSSVMQAYVAVLLGQAANVYALTPHEMDFVDTLLKRFAKKVLVSAMPPMADEHVPNQKIATVDLMSNRGCDFIASPVAEDRLRFLDLHSLSKSLRVRIHKLAEDELPADLDLPTEWSAADARALLKRLHAAWCEGAAQHSDATTPVEATATITLGIAQTHYFLSGAIFEQPDVKRELTRQEINDITLFGKVSEATTRTRNAIATGINFFSENWGLVEEGKHFVRLLRPSNSTRSIAIGKLAGIKIGDTDTFYLGVIDEIYQEISPQMAGHIFVSLDMLPGRPEATAVRSAHGKDRHTHGYIQGFRLPPNELLGLAESLIVPNGMASIGAGIDIFHPAHGSAKQVKVIEFVERGADFDRVHIA